MVITPSNCFELKVDETYPNVVYKMKEKLLEVDEIKGLTIEGQTRKTVTGKIFKRIHTFIKLHEKDYMLNLNDIVVYLDNVNYVNKTALPLIYKAMTNEDLPPIVMESHMLKNFVCEGYRSLEDDEKGFFKKNYGAGGFFLRKPSFSGSSVVSVDDMRMYTKIEKFETDFDDLLAYIEAKGDIISVDGGDFYMSRKSFMAEKFVIDNMETKLPPLVSNPSNILVNPLCSEEQTDAVRNVCLSRDKMVGLTGAAGTGKTFVISTIVDLAHANGKNIACCAFTGKAASRMEQSEVDMSKLVLPPKTIHSLMGTLKMSEYTDLDLVIIDEASTMNSELFQELLTVLENSSSLGKIKFLLVGDMNQLPPIGGGQIFEDMITLNVYPVYRLTKIFRTTDEKMLSLYNDVLKSKISVDIRKHRKFFKPYAPDSVGDTLIEVVETLFAKDRNWAKDNKCIILSHTNRYVDYINYLCYKEIRGKTIDFYEYTFADHPEGIEPEWEPIPVFWEGAKIIFTKNDKIDVKENGEVIRVNNGTTGEIVGFMDDLAMVRSYDDGRTFYIEGDYDTIKLAYAMTVFKSQGSEAQMVIYFHSNHIFETKRLAYTAMTRARRALRVYTPGDGFRMSWDVPRYTEINSQ